MAGLGDIPLMQELTDNEDDRALLRFRAEAKKRRLDLAPLSGAEVQKVYNQMIDAPAGLVARMKKVLGYK
jgi:hypothetical protein